jgi:NTE family protein
VLEQANVPIDYLAGTSIGSVIAGSYGLGHEPDDIVGILDEGGDALFRPSLSMKSLLTDTHLRRYLQSVAGHARIQDLRVPLGVVAADLISGGEVVFREGLLWPAVLASISIPGIYPAQAIGPYQLVDGSLLNPVPSDVVSDMGADVVIAVRFRGGSRVARVGATGREPRGSVPSVLQVLARSIYLMQTRLGPETESAATLIIEPQCEGASELNLRTFSQGRQFQQSGVAAAEAAIPRIAALLPWVDAGKARSGLA